MQRQLWQGTLLGTIGMGFIAIGGVFLPVEELKLWGLPLFILGFGFLTAGLLPYRRFRRLEMNPYELYVDDRWLKLVAKGQTLISIERQSIETFLWFENYFKYGIIVKMKRQADLFLPYFTERSLKDLIAEHHEA
jgi:hypothetical protein